MPTLAEVGSFNYHDKAHPTEDQKSWLSMRAIDIITKVVESKFPSKNIFDKIYFVEARTGSGKSTLMVSHLFKTIVRKMNGKMLCTEPRVVLTQSNANDILRYNHDLILGQNVGVLNGSIKINCTEISSLFYCTTQIVTDILLKVLQCTRQDQALSMLNKYKIIVIDEVHVIDLPMIGMLRCVLDVLNKYGNNSECPLFIFTSATMDLDQIVKYVFPKTYDEVYQNALMIAEVSGTPNFPIEKHYMKQPDMNNLYRMETELIKTNKLLRRCAGASLLSKYILKNFIDRLRNSESYITKNGEKIQCRDMLIFVATSAEIEIMVKLLSSGIEHDLNIPSLGISKGCQLSVLNDFRKKNFNKERFIIVGYARGFSEAADDVVALPMSNDKDVLINETKIIISTPILDTGKTFSTLYYCIDMGVQTTTVFNPLKHTVKSNSIKQIPINLSQLTQRIGRVGREGNGIFWHFYSEEAKNKLLVRGFPDTVNCYCLSKMFLNEIRKGELFDIIDIVKLNNYLYPSSVDVMICSAKDLIYSGYMNQYGIYMDALKMDSNIWVIYALYLYGWCGIGLWKSLLIASLNWKEFPEYLCIRDLKPGDLRIKLDAVLESKSFNVDIVDSIKRARNYLSKVVYGKSTPFMYLKNRIW